MKNSKNSQHRRRQQQISQKRNKEQMGEIKEYQRVCQMFAMVTLNTPNLKGRNDKIRFKYESEVWTNYRRHIRKWKEKQINPQFGLEISTALSQYFFNGDIKLVREWINWTFYYQTTWPPFIGHHPLTSAKHQNTCPF